MLVRDSEKHVIAVVSYLNDPFPITQSAIDRLHAWHHGQDCLSVSFDLSDRNSLHRVNRLDPDIIVLDATFLRRRWSLNEIEESRFALNYIADLNKYIIAAPMDEPNHPDVLQSYFELVGVNKVITCAPREQLKNLYRGFNPSDGFVESLPAVVSPEDLRIYQKIKPRSFRKYHLTYRGYRLPEHFDDFAKRKQDLAERFRQISASMDIQSSISLESSDVITSRSAWAKFLRDSCVVCGAESGMSQMRCMNKDDPRHGSQVYYRTISARHIEAALAGCVQLLVQGQYSGILRAGEHYIPIGEDMDDTELRTALKLALARESSEIAARARQAILSRPDLTSAHYATSALEGLPKRHISLNKIIEIFSMRLGFGGRSVCLRIRRAYMWLKTRLMWRSNTK